ncbi:Crp/Fnr family transcriptional regulator [Gordonia sp. DT30]|uniref:Crp/Fnr family transcriptional regulator n=1 Tax=Gordonia sp. DT30 TaxID=3416546 RepID=UPI003CEF4A16
MTLRRNESSRAAQSDRGAGAARGYAGAGRRLEFFRYLSPEARRDFDDAAVVRHFRAEQRIYMQEDRQRLMYRLLSGRVWLSYSTVDGREHLAGLLGPGEGFGISSLIDGEGLPQTAVARSDVEVQVLDEATMNRLRSAHRSIDDAIMRSLLRDIRILSSELASASLADLPSRLARQLLALAAPGPDGRPMVSLTQAELGGVLGVSRQTLNRQLRQLESEGVVRLSYGEVHLNELDRLRLLCSDLA